VTSTNHVKNGPAPAYQGEADQEVLVAPASSAPATANRPSVAGLRERKKEATREALSMAALRLALERGIANVRVGDIAAAAGVSPRTYNNYFSNREQAICALSTSARPPRRWPRRWYTPWWTATTARASRTRMFSA
jgi:pyruvate/2-oxoglutarate dehydrogenase complex dihydrolipoamide acyltransferase (E2) component